MYPIWSSAYLEIEVSPYNCYVNETLWRKITNDQNSNRIFARITNGEKFWICALGAPINSIAEDPNVFVPRWMLEQIGTSGDGQLLEIDWMPSEAFEESTKIVLKSLDTNFDSLNIQELLSNELTKLAILQKNAIININIPELDNYVISYQVVNLEPSSVVLCQGDEVVLEFDDSRPPTPYPLNNIPEILHDSIESIVEGVAAIAVNATAPVAVAAPAAPLTVGGIKRDGKFNPWRDKDFKPNMC